MKFTSILDATPEVEKPINVICVNGHEKVLMLKPSNDITDVNLWFDIEMDDYYNKVHSNMLNIAGWYYI